MVVEMRTASIPKNWAAWPHSPQITGRIVAYRNGEISFAQLLDELSQYDWKRPAHYDMHGDVRL